MYKNFVPGFQMVYRNIYDAKEPISIVGKKEAKGK